MLLSRFREGWIQLLAAQFRPMKLSLQENCLELFVDALWCRYVRGGLIECVAMQLFSFLLSEISLSLLQVPWLVNYR